MPVNLTLGMRILLHLSGFDPSREGYDLPPDVTQQGIADVLSVRQSDVSRALARMRSDGQVEERSASIAPGRAGRKQRLKVYFLSVRGREAAQALAARLLDVKVRLPPAREGGEERAVPLRDVNMAMGTNLPLLRLAGMVSPEGALVPPSPAPGPVKVPGAPPQEGFFVGRNGELTALMEKIAKGPETLLVVSGIAGVGKTTLAGRLLSSLKDRPGFYFRIRGWASYEPLLHALRDFLCRSGRRRLAAALRRGGSPPFDEVLDALRRDLDGLGAVLLLDDFHESSGQPELRHLARELLEVLPALRPPSRLLLFSRTAPAVCDPRELAVRRNVWELPLGGLDDASAAALAARAGFPPHAAAAVASATRGHPLSIMLAGGAPGPGGGAEASRLFLQEEVIGGIPPGERQLLQVLSVLRRPEPSGTVLGMSDDPLAFDALSALVSRSLASLSGGRYEVHEMVRDAAYGRLPDGTRRAIHTRAAALYLRSGGVEGESEAVYHFLRAGEPDRAAQLLLSIGGSLIDRGRFEECRSLLDLLGGAAPAEREGLWRLRQDLLSAYGEWDLGYEYLFQCSVLETVTGLGLEAPGARNRSPVEWGAAISEHERALGLLRRIGDRAGQCELWSSLGWMRLLRGERRLAAEAFRKILQVPPAPDCHAAAVKAGQGLGHVAWLSGRPRAAATRYLATLRKLGPDDAGARIACLNFVANLASARSELEGAARRLEEALELCGRGRHRRERAYTLLHLGRVRSLLGMPDAAVAALGTALEELRGIGDAHGAVFARMALSAHHLSAGRPAEALDLAEAAARECDAPELGALGAYAARLSKLAGRGNDGGAAPAGKESP
ncbi:MAG: hypothetical protein FJ149_02185 [Euryarchaeota archaeon]|nr:hypothetical protein [Euryarchaeota archaeon]